MKTAEGNLLLKQHSRERTTLPIIVVIVIVAVFFLIATMNSILIPCETNISKEAIFKLKLEITMTLYVRSVKPCLLERTSDYVSFALIYHSLEPDKTLLEVHKKISF